MKERGILFNAAMVRAILDGSKTQTRRVCRHAEYESLSRVIPASKPGDDKITPGYFGDEEGDVLFKSQVVPGDQLWVKETFCPIYPQDPNYNGGHPIEYDYFATYKHGDRMSDLMGEKKKWTPSIHMPRRASRIQLEITGVRVERLNVISEEDAEKEGVVKFQDGKFANYLSESGYALNAKSSYASLWESINGSGSWDANPWVWVFEFKVVKR